MVSSPPMSSERQKIESAIRVLEAQRAMLGDAVVDAALAPLRAKLTALAAAPADSLQDQTLKQVTILFLDIVGSTNLSQHLDPEQTSAVMDGALAQFASIVGQHDGKVLNSPVTACWPFSARTKPARTIRSVPYVPGSRWSSGPAAGQRVLRQYGHAGFNVRVGVHTGGVLLGGGVDAEGSIRGQAVNIAARMEQTAPAGALRISQDTYRHVSGIFDVDAAAAPDGKGIDEPISTYVVLRARPRAFRMAARGIEGVETRMIGRDAELERLRQAFHRLCSEGTLPRSPSSATLAWARAVCCANSKTGSRLQPEAICMLPAAAPIR